MNTDMEFVSGHWKRLQEIKERWKQQLNEPMPCPHVRFIGKNIAVVNFQHLRTWSVAELFGRAEPLRELADKIEWMIDKGHCPNVLPFIVATLERGYFKSNCGGLKEFKLDLTEEHKERIKQIFEII
jgi:hypothetical protein